LAEHEITVALIVSPDDPQRQMIPQREWERPYRDRRKVRLTADSSSSLADVMQEAIRRLGVAPEWEQPPSVPAYRRIAFYKPEDEEAFAPRAMPQLHWAQLVLVDDSGQAIFGVSDQRAVTISDLLQAAEAGVVEGDPLRPYLIIEPGWGDMPPPDWPTVLAGLEVVWDVLERVAVVGGVWAFAEQIRQRLRDRIEAGKGAAEKHREWAQRGIRPYQFAALIRTRNWKTEELAKLLGCSDSEAEAVLWILGFSYDEDNNAWISSGDIEASVIQAINDQIAIASHRGGRNWKEDLRQRVIQLLETGESPPVDAPEPDENQLVNEDWLNDDEWEPTAGERLGSILDYVLARLRRRR
jgi:hypothetical protein